MGLCLAGVVVEPKLSNVSQGIAGFEGVCRSPSIYTKLIDEKGPQVSQLELLGVGARPQPDGSGLTGEDDSPNPQRL